MSLRLNLIKDHLKYVFKAKDILDNILDDILL